MTAPLSQCDGCRRGLPLRSGVHYGSSGYDMIGCTADRYAPKARKPIERKTKLKSKKALPKVNPERQAKRRRNYKRSLSTATAKLQRVLLLQRSRGRCENCGVLFTADNPMHRSHLRYARLGNELMSDVAAHCRDCNMAERASRSWYRGRKLA